MTDWITHGSTSPPELAPAALVEVESFGSSREIMGVDEAPWMLIKYYRPLTDDEGHKLISAEGLEPWARWVTTDEGGEVWQFVNKPIQVGNWWDIDDGDDQDTNYGTKDTPSAFSHPGDWRDSLYRVEGR